MNIHEFIKAIQGLSAAEKEFISEVVLIFRLKILAPATNAISERSFSALWRLKTYLRSTMGDNRLENLMVLHIHKDVTDTLNLINIANKFVGEIEGRKRMFGRFTDRDIEKPKKYSSVATQTC